MLTSFIDGEMVERGANTPAGLYAMVRTMGRLYALGPVDDNLPRAQFMPERAASWAPERLTTVANRVPAEWRYPLEEMLRTLAATPTLTEGPVSLIHNDCHPGNAVRRADGEVALIDWDGAGLGAGSILVPF